MVDSWSGQTITGVTVTTPPGCFFSRITFAQDSLQAYRSLQYIPLLRVEVILDLVLENTRDVTGPVDVAVRRSMQVRVESIMENWIQISNTSLQTITDSLVRGSCVVNISQRSVDVIVVGQLVDAALEELAAAFPDKRAEIGLPPLAPPPIYAQAPVTPPPPNAIMPPQGLTAEMGLVLVGFLAVLLMLLFVVVRLLRH